MTTGETHGYILTFRCVNCGRYEASASYASEAVMSAEQIRTRIYEAICKGCGWKGEACGICAVQIHHAMGAKAKAKAAGQQN